MFSLRTVTKQSVSIKLVCLPFFAKIISKMPVKTKELRQFICPGCPGKYDHHKYRLWYGRVSSNNLESQCHVCKKMKTAVHRGEEEGVHICHFKCSCDHTYVVRCTMQNTAPCYECRKDVSPNSFEPLRRIRRCTDNTHNCNSCNGSGKCPNMRRQPGESIKLREVD